jgi:hypothetical protein
MRSRAGLIALVTIVLAAAACGPGTASRSEPSAAPPAASQHPMRMAAATVAASPKESRAQFEQLLGLHALLAVRQMRSVVVAAAAGFGRAAGASLQATPTR